MDTLDGLAFAFDLPGWAEVWRSVWRLSVAALLGAVVGIQRERAGKPAGLRTHMLVALGAALFVLGAQETGMSVADLSRVIQGLVTGIGFIGAGAILKSTRGSDVKGLTSAGGIWITAAAGVAVGLGQWVPASVGVGLGWLILAALGRVEARLAGPARRGQPWGAGRMGTPGGEL